MNYLGATVTAASIFGAKENLLMEDVNQLPYINRKNPFEMFYLRSPQFFASAGTCCILKVVP